ncbi:MAG: hypothetical protein VR72_17190 [Clostridiaceae bacterium BRH_c20a]|nr:MAG: hypothetical protein VR72_17190 [Clostridiaceae bacterium BRH_c20a]
MKKLKIDYSKCTGCRLCELTCSFELASVFNPEKSAIRTIRHGIPEQTIVAFCKHCAKPACFEACPTAALMHNKETRVVMVNKEECIGCGLCVEACPIPGSIHLGDDSVPIKCNLCNGDPACVRVCASGALAYEEQGTAKKFQNHSEKVLENVLRSKNLTKQDIVIS